MDRDNGPQPTAEWAGVLKRYGEAVRETGQCWSDDMAGCLYLYNGSEPDGPVAIAVHTDEDDDEAGWDIYYGRDGGEWPPVPDEADIRLIVAVQQAVLARNVPA